MKRVGIEIWIVIAALAFLASWLIDRVAGPVSIQVKDPIAFLKSTALLNKYPFTATAMLIRTFGLFVSAMIVTSAFNRRYFTKALILLVIGILAEFFAIQQLATGFRVTTIQWTLSIAYGSLLITLGIFWMTLKGIWGLFNKEESPETSREENKIGSVLEPKEGESSV